MPIRRRKSAMVRVTGRIECSLDREVTPLDPLWAGYRSLAAKPQPTRRIIGNTMTAAGLTKSLGLVPAGVLPLAQRNIRLREPARSGRPSSDPEGLWQRRVAPGYESRDTKVLGLPSVRQGHSLGRDHCAACGRQYRVARRNIPLAGGRKARIDVGASLGDVTEFER